MVMLVRWILRVKSTWCTVLARTSRFICSSLIRKSIEHFHVRLLNIYFWLPDWELYWEAAVLEELAVSPPGAADRVENLCPLFRPDFPVTWAVPPAVATVDVDVVVVVFVTDAIFDIVVIVVVVVVVSSCDSLVTASELSPAYIKVKSGRALEREKSFNYLEVLERKCFSGPSRTNRMSGPTTKSKSADCCTGRSATSGQSIFNKFDRMTSISGERKKKKESPISLQVAMCCSRRHLQTTPTSWH